MWNRKTDTAGADVFSDPLNRIVIGQGVDQLFDRDGYGFGHAVKLSLFRVDFRRCHGVFLQLKRLPSWLVAVEVKLTQKAPNEKWRIHHGLDV
jgi:hypothetical protein